MIDAEVKYTRDESYRLFINIAIDSSCFYYSVYFAFSINICVRLELVHVYSFSGVSKKFFAQPIRLLRVTYFTN